MALVVMTRIKTRCRARMTDLLGMGSACHVRWAMWPADNIVVHGEGPTAEMRFATVYRPGTMGDADRVDLTIAILLRFGNGLFSVTASHTHAHFTLHMLGARRTSVWTSATEISKTCARTAYVVYCTL